jgi:hypothetical protein
MVKREGLIAETAASPQSELTFAGASFMSSLPVSVACSNATPECLLSRPPPQGPRNCARRDRLATGHGGGSFCMRQALLHTSRRRLTRQNPVNHGRLEWRFRLCLAFIRRAWCWAKPSASGYAIGEFRCACSCSLARGHAAELGRDAVRRTRVRYPRFLTRDFCVLGAAAASTVNAAGASGNLPGPERFSVHGPGFSSQIFLSGPPAP